MISRAPPWARARSPQNPAAPPKIAGNGTLFVTAAARRYSGRFEGLPGRPLSWEAWLEPNLQPQLSPQLVNRVPYAAVYRSMVNSMAAALATVRPDDRLVIGGLGPSATRRSGRRSRTPTGARSRSCGPSLRLSATLQRSATNRSVLTSGTSIPTRPVGRVTRHCSSTTYLRRRHAQAQGECSTPLAGQQSQHAARPRLLGHGFSWDSEATGPYGVPTSIMSRWVPQALFELWRSGASRS